MLPEEMLREDDRDAFGTFNMGAGFAAYVAPEDTARCLDCAAENGYEAWRGGKVCKEGDRKAVVIEPVDVVFEGDTLRVR